MSGSVLSSFGSQGRSMVKPPDNGSFPIDHKGECKADMLKFMACLKKNSNDSSKCRLQSKEYLECRMNNDLMEKETWKNLGYADLVKEAE